MIIITARASAETLVHQMYSGGVHRDVGRPSLSAMLSGCMHVEMTCTGCIHVISEEVVRMRFREAGRHYAGLAYNRVDKPHAFSRVVIPTWYVPGITIPSTLNPKPCENWIPWV